MRKYGYKSVLWIQKDFFRSRIRLFYSFRSGLSRRTRNINCVKYKKATYMCNMAADPNSPVTEWSDRIRTHKTKTKFFLFSQTEKVNSVCVVGRGGAHSPAVEGLGESQFRRGDMHCGTVLFIYTYFVAPRILNQQLIDEQYSTVKLVEMHRNSYRSSTMNNN